MRISLLRKRGSNPTYTHGGATSAELTHPEADEHLDPTSDDAVGNALALDAAHVLAHRCDADHDIRHPVTGSSFLVRGVVFSSEVQCPLDTVTAFHSHVHPGASCAASGGSSRRNRSVR
jgi:hypothetical protein